MDETRPDFGTPQRWLLTIGSGLVIGNLAMGNNSAILVGISKSGYLFPRQWN